MIGVSWLSDFGEVANINWYGSGDIAINVNPTVLGAPGSQYTILGWRRLTARDAGNVLGVDWVEIRCPTGT